MSVRFFWLSERGWQQEDTAAAGLQIQINQSIVLLNTRRVHRTETPSDVMTLFLTGCQHFSLQICPLLSSSCFSNHLVYV